MYNIEELNVRLLSELKEIAEKLGVKNYKRLPKSELIYKILDQQAVTPESELREKVAEKPKKAEKPAKKENSKESSNQSKSKRRPRVQRENVKVEKDKKKAQPESESDMSAEELLGSFDLEIDSSITSFESASPAEEPSKEETSTETVEKPEDEKAPEAVSPVAEKPAPTAPDRERGDKTQRRDRNDSGRGKKNTASILKEFDGIIENEGVLEIMQDGYGFLRSSDYN